MIYSTSKMHASAVQTVGDLDLLGPVSCPSHASLTEALAILEQDPSLSLLALTNLERKVTQIVAAEDLRRAVQHPRQQMTPASLALAESAIILATTPIRRAAHIFATLKLPALAVVDAEGYLQGYIEAHSVIEALLQHPSTAPEASPSNTSVETTSSLSQHNSVNQFLSYVAHDIRNPISMLVSISHLLEDAQEKPQSQEISPELLARAKRRDKLNGLLRRAAKQALHISDCLLSLNQYATGADGETGSHITPKSVELSEFLQDIFDENTDFVQMRGMELVLEQCDRGIASFDPLLVKRALLNLIDNACKHNRRFGRIYLALNHHQDNEALEIAVRDEGEGIAADKVEAIFQPFKRIESESQALGYGLGLAIARRFAELHGGSLLLGHQHKHKKEKDRTSGATFILKIPTRPPVLTTTDNQAHGVNPPASLETELSRL